MLLSNTQIKQVNLLLSRGEIKESLDMLIDFLEEKNSIKPLNNAVLLRSRYEALEQQYSQMSIISHQEYDQARNKIIFGVQNLMTEQTATDIDYSRERKVKPSTLLSLIGVIAIGLILVFAFLKGNWDFSGSRASENRVPNDSLTQVDHALNTRSSLNEIGSEAKNLTPVPAIHQREEKRALKNITLLLDAYDSKVFIDNELQTTGMGKHIRTLQLTEEKHRFRIEKGTGTPCEFELTVTSKVDKINEANFCN